MFDFMGRVSDRNRLVACLVLLGACAVLRFHPLGWLLGAVGVWAGLVWRERPGCRLVACVLVASPIPIWQLSMAVALGVYRASGGPLHLARGAWLPGWTALCGGVTPFALIAWFVLARPDLSDLDALYGSIPVRPALVLVGALLFVFFNALLEEVIWRGVLQPDLAASGTAASAVVLQAASFGLAHAHGFPRGPVGVTLAFVWALMLGALRSRSGGLLAPFLAHVVADAVIAILVVGWVIGQ